MSELDKRLVRKRANLCELERLRGIGPKYCTLLNAVGVNSISELSESDPSEMHAKILTFLSRNELVRRPPTSNRMCKWIEEAKTLKKTSKHLRLRLITDSDVVLPWIFLVAKVVVLPWNYLSVSVDLLTVAYFFYTFDVFNFLGSKRDSKLRMYSALLVTGGGLFFIFLDTFGWYFLNIKLSSVQTDQPLKIIYRWFILISQLGITKILMAVSISTVLLALYTILTNYLVPLIHRLSLSGSYRDAACPLESPSREHKRIWHAFLVTAYFLGAIWSFVTMFSLRETFPGSAGMIYSSVLIMWSAYSVLAKFEMISKGKITSALIKLICTPKAIIYSVVFFFSVSLALSRFQMFAALYSYAITHFLEINLLWILGYFYFIGFITLYPLTLLVNLMKEYLTEAKIEPSKPMKATYPYLTLGVLFLLQICYLISTLSGMAFLYNLVFLAVLSWPIWLILSKALAMGQREISKRGEDALLILVATYYLLYVPNTYQLTMSTSLQVLFVLSAILLVSSFLYYYLSRDFLRRLSFGLSFSFSIPCLLPLVLLSGCPPILWWLHSLFWISFGLFNACWILKGRYSGLRDE